MGLAEGRSKILCGELTLHTHTAIEIMHQATQVRESVLLIMHPRPPGMHVAIDI